MRRLDLLLVASVFTLATALPLGCWGPAWSPPAGLGGGGGAGGGMGPSGTTTVATTGSTGSTGGGSTGDGGPPPGLLCPTVFSFVPPAGAKNVRVPGEWQGFDLPSAPAMTGPDSSGAYKATVKLAPGLWAYKLVYDDSSMTTNWVLDPNQGRRKYVGGVENSAMKVPDCSLPSFLVTKSTPSRAAPGQGSYAAQLTYQDAIDGSGADPSGFSATLIQAGTQTPLGASQFKVDASGGVTISLSGLADGKYHVNVTGKTKSGKVSDPIRLIFWIEAEAYSWQDALVYMVMTDRYRDGDPTNNASPTANVDPREDFQGGDYQGVLQSINDGTFDKLGVRALWLSPFNTNPKGAYLASDGAHLVMGYHGYWPVKAREVEPRWGGQGALQALVTAAHQHGIRVMQDWVIHHVHQDHEYISMHPTWFNSTGCVCGTNNCDWTVHALDCVFTPYLPNIDHTNPDADAAFVADAVWWVDTFDLDGLRIDAVKQVPEAATRNLAAEVRETFQQGGTPLYLLGETAMGWNNCADPCNDINYDTISHYIGPLGLDGQFDFVLYYAVSTTMMAYGDQGMIHADYWFNHGQQKWPAGAIMSPYLGSQDTPRFATLADYRGQDPAHDRSIPSNQWTNIAAAPTDSEPYRRTRIAMAWLLGLPGAPLVYYGDEYGQWGGADPNNRLMWRPATALTADESATLAFTQKLGLARKGAVPMRRGSYVQMVNNLEDTLVFGRLVAPGQASIVGITRLTTPSPVTFDASPLGFSQGTVLHDAMGGPDVTVGAPGQTMVTIPASGAVILSP